MQSFKQSQAVAKTGFLAYPQFIAKIKGHPLATRSYKNLMAVDLGEKRCGISILNPQVGISLPQGWIPTARLLSTPLLLANLVRENSIYGIVVGCIWPLSPLGQLIIPAAPQDKQQMRMYLNNHYRFLAVADSAATGCVLYDEHFTTARAHQLMSDHGIRRKERHARDDAVAASLLLESFYHQFASELN